MEAEEQSRGGAPDGKSSSNFQFRLDDVPELRFSSDLPITGRALPATVSKTIKADHGTQSAPRPKPSQPILPVVFVIDPQCYAVCETYVKSVCEAIRESQKDALLYVTAVSAEAPSPRLISIFTSDIGYVLRVFHSIFYMPEHDSSSRAPGKLSDTSKTGDTPQNNIPASNGGPSPRPDAKSGSPSAHVSPTPSKASDRDSSQKDLLLVKRPGRNTSWWRMITPHSLLHAIDLAHRIINKWQRTLNANHPSQNSTSFSPRYLIIITQSDAEAETATRTVDKYYEPLQDFTSIGEGLIAPASGSRVTSMVEPYRPTMWADLARKFHKDPLGSPLVSIVSLAPTPALHAFWKLCGANLPDEFLSYSPIGDGAMVKPAHSSHVIYTTGIVPEATWKAFYSSFNKPRQPKQSDSLKRANHKSTHSESKSNTNGARRASAIPAVEKKPARDINPRPSRAQSIASSSEDPTPKRPVPALANGAGAPAMPLAPSPAIAPTSALPAGNLNLQMPSLVGMPHTLPVQTPQPNVFSQSMPMGLNPQLTQQTRVDPQLLSRVYAQQQAAQPPFPQQSSQAILTALQQQQQQQHSLDMPNLSQTSVPPTVNPASYLDPQTQPQKNNLIAQYIAHIQQRFASREISYEDASNRILALQQMQQ